MRGKAHDDSTKAAVMASLMQGQGVNEVARQYSLSSSVVTRWKAELGDKLEQVGAQKTRDFGDMLGNYLEQLLITVTAQQEHFRDVTWLKRQPAADLAVLHGVLVDKGVRLFEAAQNAAQVNDGAK